MTNAKPYIDLEDFFKYIANLDDVFEMDIDKFSDFDSSNNLQVRCTSNSYRIIRHASDSYRIHLEIQYCDKTYNIDIKPPEVKSIGPIAATNFIKDFLSIKNVQSKLFVSLYHEIAPQIMTYLDQNKGGLLIGTEIRNPITRNIIGTWKPILKYAVLDSEYFHVVCNAFRDNHTLCDHLLCNTLWFCYVDTMNFLNQ